MSEIRYLVTETGTNVKNIVSILVTTQSGDAKVIRDRRIWWLADEFVHFCDNSRSTFDSMVRSHGEKHRRLTNLQLGA